MRTRAARRLALVLLLAAALLGACSCASSRSTVHKAGRYRKATRVDSYILIAKERAGRPGLVIEIDNDAGRVSWTLTDPQGRVAWQDSVQGDESAKRAAKLERIVGEWTIELELVDATGRYEVRWEAG